MLTRSPLARFRTVADNASAGEALSAITSNISTVIGQTLDAATLNDPDIHEAELLISLAEALTRIYDRVRIAQNIG